LEQNLKQKKILITGGTSELGSRFVCAALSEGAEVYFTYHQNQNCADGLCKQGAKGFRLDLSDCRAIDEFAEVFKTHTADLHILIHNGAAVSDVPLLHLAEEEWDYVMKVNLKAPYYLTQKLLPLFLAIKKHGQSFTDAQPCRKIFMITSRAAVMGGAGISHYAASKAGVIGLAQSLAQELGKRSILVNAVNPGFMLSRMTKAAGEKVIEKNRFSSVIQQHSDPSEVAEFLVYLCSDKVSRISGQVFHYDSRAVSG
jgi:3-oxoacyl-[acyl-carrier protein] reductase